MKNTIKNWYIQNFKDELGFAININLTFGGLLRVLLDGKNVYDYIGVLDSVIRERCFAELAVRLHVEYDFVYNLYISGNNTQTG